MILKNYYNKYALDSNKKEVSFYRNVFKWLIRGFISGGLIYLIYLWHSRYFFNSKQSQKILDWNFIIFSQSYPIGYCIIWKENSESSNSCRFMSDKYAWSIHGIWPSNFGKQYPEFCKNVSFSIEALDPIMDELKEHWASVQSNNSDKFWKHEWMKHGSCASEESDFDTEIKYFSQGLKWNNQLNVKHMLQESNIYPSDTQPYTAFEIQNSIKSATGFNPSLHCEFSKKHNIYILTEIRFCFSISLNLQDCDNYKTTDNSCPDNDIYYVKNI